MKQGHFRFFLMASAFFHLGFIGALLRSSTQNRPVADPIVVEIVAQKVGEQKPLRSGTSSTRPRGRKFSATSFLPSWGDQFQRSLLSATDVPTPPESLAAVRELFADPFSYGATASGQLTTGRGTYEEIFRRVNSNLIYDSILGEYNHFGSCYFYFAVNNLGTLFPESLRARCSDRVLKVKSARILRKVLREELPESLRFRTSEKHWIAARFVFARKAPCAALNGSAGNFLTFCRTNSTSPVASSRLGDFMEAGELGTRDPSENKKEIHEALGPALPHQDLQVGYRGNYEDFLDYDQRRYRKETKFNPFQSEERDPDWEL